MIYFTADTHFGHANIIEYCQRPFSSVGEMDQALIRNWNEVIGPDDIVYHLGDFTLGEPKQAQLYFSQLNGYIIVPCLPWHHDRRWQKISLGRPYFESASRKYVTLVASSLDVLQNEEHGQDDYPLTITLCHYPLAEWDRKHYGAWHLHGHSHGRYHAPGMILDVGVDAQNYRPISLEDLVDAMVEKQAKEAVNA